MLGPACTGIVGESVSSVPTHRGHSYSHPFAGLGDTPTPGLPPRDSRSGGQQRSPQPNVKGQDTGDEKGNRTFCTRCLIRLDMLGRGTPQKRKYQSRDLKLKEEECRCPGPEPPGIDSSTPPRTPQARAALSTGHPPSGTQSHPPLSPHPLPEGCCGRRWGQWEPRLGGRGNREGLPEDGTC